MTKFPCCSPCYRSLLFEVTCQWSDWLRTPACSDDVIDIYVTPQHLIIATWKVRIVILCLCKLCHIDVTHFSIYILRDHVVYWLRSHRLPAVIT